MMKRILISLILAVATLSLVGSVFASPSMWGSKGLFRVIDAQNAGSMSFSIGSYGTYWTKSKTPATGTKVEKTSIWVYPALSFAPLKFIELSAVIPYAVQNKTKTTTSTGTTTTDITGLEDARVGLKFSYSPTSVFSVGLDAWVAAPTRADTFRSRKTPNLFKDKNNPDVGGDLLLSFDILGKAKFHINGGGEYTLDETDTTGPDQTNQKFAKLKSNITANYGAGIEVNALPYVTPIVEVTGSYLLIDDKDSSNFIRKTAKSTALTKPGPLDQGIFITGGLKADFAFAGAHHLTLGVGGDYPYSSKRVDPSLGADSANGKATGYDWQVIGGLTYSYVPPVAPPVPPTGSIAGTVTDKEGAAIEGVEVSFPGTSVSAVSTGPDGRYTATGLPVGTVTVSASKDGFLPNDITATIAKKKIATGDLQLEKKPIPTGTFAGTVKDIDGKIVPATITVGDKSVTADLATGQFTVSLPAGSYTATATASGYYDRSISVSISENQQTTEDLLLVPSGYTARLSAKFLFGVGKYTLQPGAGPELDKIAKILNDNPSAKVEVGGYTDSRGSKRKNYLLSQKRADTVRDALISRGVSSDRLIAKGYGPEDPIDSNKTYKGRMNNRRVEIKFQ